MRRLLLLRHAKSSWNQGNLDDAARPLAPRGRRAAPLMGRLIRGRKLVPDLVLCSTAVRARQTLELVTAEWERMAGPGARSELRTSLYLASAAELLSAVKRLDDDIERAMIVGHNPGMASLASLLATTGDTEALKVMAMKFPTAALAVIEFDVDSWKAVLPDAGRLQSFVRPRDLG